MVKGIMDEMFILIGKVVGAVGGAGFIIVACSSFIAKLWADWFMKKKSIEYDKVVEEYRSQLSVEIEKSKAMNDRVSHKNKKVFDFEIGIYQEAIILLNNAVDMIQRLLAEIAMLNMSAITKIGGEINESIWEFSKFITRNSFLMNKDIYELFKEIDMELDEIRRLFLEAIVKDGKSELIGGGVVKRNDVGDSLKQKQEKIVIELRKYISDQIEN